MHFVRVVSRGEFEQPHPLIRSFGTTQDAKKVIEI